MPGVLVVAAMPSGLVALAPSAFVDGVRLVSGARSRRVMCVMTWLKLIFGPDTVRMEVLPR